MLTGIFSFLFFAQIATVLPLIYTLLTVAATHQLGFVRLNADSLMGFRLFGVPLEELASVRFRVEFSFSFFFFLLFARTHALCSTLF